MKLELIPQSSEDWISFLTQKSKDRCDLDILLRDQCRHKVIVRDNRQTYFQTNQCSIVIPNKSVVHIQNFLRKNQSLSFQGLVLLAFHVALGAYGHGKETVTALLNVDRGHDIENSRLLPIFFDHDEQASASCLNILEQIEELFQQENAFVDQKGITRRGLFDAALVLTDPDFNLPTELLFPFTLFILEDRETNNLQWIMSYAHDLFEGKVISGVLDVIKEVVLQIVQNPTLLLKDLELISETQKKQLIEWNKTDGNFPTNLRLNELVDHSIEKTPNFEALVYENQSITYSELDAQIKRFATWLMDFTNEIKPNDVIALYLDKSDKVVFTILAIWKIGAAFVPIDTNYPAERVKFILKDSRAKCVITNRRHKEKLNNILSSFELTLKLLEVEDALSFKQCCQIFPDFRSTDLAYVTYTSGTTGFPKGVPKYHQSVVNSITDLSTRYDMLEIGTERVGLFAAYVFEPFIRQMLIALINSQTLVVVPEDIKMDPDLLPNFLKKEKITYLNGTGSVLQHFDMRGLNDLKRLLLVGEELTPTGLRQLREWFQGRIVNEYAFTESAFVTAIKEFSSGESSRVDRSIGRPLRNVKCYVLSENFKQVPIGAIGELYIGGMGVAQGYLNREDLTKERFLENPFQTAEEKALGVNDRIYKTGDLARMLKNGEYEYMGRSDFQLKINGIRVEPGEIEAKALTLTGVKKCVVVASKRAGGDRFLVGYFVTEKSSDLTELDLIHYLEKQLIRVMVPARMVKLDHIPVNVNGKVDRTALPKVTEFLPDFLKQTSQTQKKKRLIDELRSIWSEVLKIPIKNIKNEDDFFRLGGQSILCILLLAQVRKKMKCHLQVSDIFRLRTLKQIAYFIENQANNAFDQESSSILEDDQTLSFPANGLHQGLLYQAMKAKTSNDAYIMQSVYHYKSQIEPDLLKRAWEYAFCKYPGLRLHFKWEKEPLQIINHTKTQLNWYFNDISTMESLKDQDQWIKDLQEKDRKNLYDMETGPLFRIYLIKREASQFTLIFSCHHIILDGWSLPLLHDEVHRLYLRLMERKDVKIDQDKAYVAAQNYWAKHHNNSVDYWLKQIDFIEERCDLKGLLKEEKKYRVNLSHYDHVDTHCEKQFVLNAKLTSDLKKTCCINHLTLHSILQFVWHKTLHAFGAGKTTVVGTIVSGRNLPIDDIENSIGLFINTLPLVVDHQKHNNKSVVEVLKEIQDAVNEMNTRSVVELGRLQNGRLKRTLFDSLLVLENYPQFLDEEEAQTHHDTLRFEHAYDIDKVDYPLAVVAREKSNKLVVALWYAGELFDEQIIDFLLETVEKLFEQVAADLTSSALELELCSEKTLSLFDNWNRTDASFSEKKTLSQIFEEIVKKYPHEKAVVFGDKELSYKELNEKANQLAHYLCEEISLSSNSLIALVLDKSEMMIVAILAVWKTGAAYVPIDPQFPNERIAFMLKDTKACGVLTNQHHGDRITSLKIDKQPVLKIEEIHFDKLQKINLEKEHKSTDLAYAIYTSGTTGNPKAVLVAHQGVVNLQESLAKTFSLSKEKRRESILSFSNYVFDHFVEQMIDALLNGQKLVVLQDEMRADQSKLLKYIEDNQVTYLSGTPSVLSLYDFSNVSSLLRIDAIGEDFSKAVFGKIRSSFNGMIINGYGPTEVSITTHKKLYGPKDWRLNKSIGHPVANTKCYVLNQALKRVPIGGIGELYIGGMGVAYGYLNQKTLTEERFLPNPFQSEEEKRRQINGKIYKTGDLVRWLPNGELEYLGRSDFQVKIRGHRIELSEIEAVLSAFPGISRSFIVLKEQRVSKEIEATEKYLVGFYLSKKEIEEQKIKKWMRTKLTETMVPARIMRIHDIPVTVNGKLDAKKLPDVDLRSLKQRDRILPQSDLENTLVEIWAKVLHLNSDCIGIQDDFFSLGGDSIRAISLAQAVKNDFKCQFSISVVFKCPTIHEQSEYLQKILQSKSNQKSIEQIDTSLTFKDQIPISLAQQRLLFIDDFEGGSAAYNIPFCLETNHTQTHLKNSLKKLVCRHPALRTLLVKTKEGTGIQKILVEEEAISLLKISDRLFETYEDLDKAIINSYRHVFDLERELPIKIDFFKCLGASNKLFLNLIFHHSCFDGWSWEIFRKELSMLCSGTSEKLLKKLTVSYADFAVFQKKLLKKEIMGKLEKFWTKFLSGSETAAFPEEKSRPPQFDYLGREIAFHIDEKTTKKLKELAKTCCVSLYSVLLGAFGLVVKMFSGQKDFIIGTPYANRMESKFEGVIGFFANLVALRIQIDPTQTIKKYIGLIGEAVKDAQSHQEMPFEELVRCLNVPNDPSRNPLVQMIFTLQDNANLGERVSVDKKLNMDLYRPDSKGWTMTKFDVTVMLSEKQSGLEGNFTYAAALYTEEGIRQFIAVYVHYLEIFAHMAAQLDFIKLKEIPPFNPKQTKGISDQFVPSALPQTAKHVFEEVVRKHPERQAVVFAEKKLKYKELNEKADQLAHYLCEKVFLKPNDLVALILDKSDKMIIAILAVWKAGAAYVPIDPQFPDERIAFMLKDIDAKAVITNQNYVEKLSKEKSPIIAIEKIELKNIKETHQKIEPHHLAYAIYTSGTTGNPKAVLVSHGNLCSFLKAVQSQPFFCDNVLFLSNFVFDFSIEQIVLSVLMGNQLLIPDPKWTIFDKTFYEFLDREKLTYLSGTPTQIHQFDLSKIPSLKTVLVAGEPFEKHHFEKIRASFLGQIYSAYGTTETTVYNTITAFKQSEEYQKNLGEPLSNTHLYVLDEHLQSVPDRAIGELCIAGECVSVGYLHQRELTHEKFVHNPYQNQDHSQSNKIAVIYKTGDLVRRLPTGTLEYKGRNDKQLKINGLRIEPEEIQATLMQYSNVKQCAAVLHSEQSSGKPQLVGYIVAKEDCPLEEDEILGFLKKRLPSVMIPSRIIQVKKSLPMTINGKLDVTSLVKLLLPKKHKSYTPPRNRIDAILCELWGNLLGCTKLGIDDHFFKIGGDSIKAMMLVTQMQKWFKDPLNVKHLFDYPTIRELVDHIFKEAPIEENNQLNSREIKASGQCPLLPIQKWFFSLPLSRPSHWNQHFAIKTPALDVGKLKKALGLIVNYHDAFRLRYRFLNQNDSKTIDQFYCEEKEEVYLHVLDVKGKDPKAIQQYLTKWESGFDLAEGPLWCAAYLHGFNDQSNRVWFSMHHLIVDSVSWHIILQDLEVAYYGGSLGNKSGHYSEWGKSIQNYSPLLEEKQLWKKLAKSVNAYNKDVLIPFGNSKNKNQASFQLSKSDTQALLFDCHQVYDTHVTDYLMTAAGFAIQSVTKQSTNYITLESHGRPYLEKAPSVHKTVGWFTALYPIEISVSKNWKQSLLETKTLRESIPNKGIGYGAIHQTYGNKTAPLPLISLNYLGHITPEKEEEMAWALDPKMCGISKGEGNEKANQFAVDMTMYCVGNQLIVEIASALGVQETERMSNELKKHLKNLIHNTQKNVGQSLTPFKQSHQEFDPYIHVNEGNKKPILFCLPPGEGGAESYLNNIAKHLTDIQLVLFNNIHLFSPMKSFEIIGKYYLKHIKQLQPNGPYQLLGWSFGGVLALEIALQLAKEGERIENLFLIDSYFDVHYASKQIGLGDVDHILDPINYYYKPNINALNQLQSTDPNVILFKAEKFNNQHAGESQKKLFKNYMQSSYNYLDHYFPLNIIKLEKLLNDTHHSWVKNQAQILKISHTILESLLNQTLHT